MQVKSISTHPGTSRVMGAQRQGPEPSTPLPGATGRSSPSERHTAFRQEPPERWPSGSFSPSPLSGDSSHSQTRLCSAPHRVRALRGLRTSLAGHRCGNRVPVVKQPANRALGRFRRGQGPGFLIPREFPLQRLWVSGPAAGLQGTPGGPYLAPGHGQDGLGRRGQSREPPWLWSLLN